MMRLVKVKGQSAIEIDEEELSNYIPITPSEDASAPKKYTKYELQLLNKDEQVALLNKLGETDIPKLEKDRVSKLVELGATHV